MKHVKYTVRRLRDSFESLCVFLTPTWVAGLLILLLPHDGFWGAVRETIFSNTLIVFAACLVQVGCLVFWAIRLADIWLWGFPANTREKKR